MVVEPVDRQSADGHVVGPQIQRGRHRRDIDDFDFGTVTGGDYSGDIALVFTDPFGSVAGNADLAFGVFDNLVVVPEPSAGLLLMCGIGALFLRRRR